MSTGGADKSGSGGGGAGGPVKTPSDFLKSIRGRPVVVKLNSGVDYRGPSPSLSRFHSTNPRKRSMFSFSVVRSLVNSVDSPTYETSVEINQATGSLLADNFLSRRLGRRARRLIYQLENY
jgi:hypothetical protein